jgi:hypothetical protein
MVNVPDGMGHEVHQTLAWEQIHARLEQCEANNLAITQNKRWMKR